MMMIMSRFVERVLNSPRARCQSAEQVSLQMSSERQGGESYPTNRFIQRYKSRKNEFERYMPNGAVPS